MHIIISVSSQSESKSILTISKTCSLKIDYIAFEALD